MTSNQRITTDKIKFFKLKIDNDFVYADTNSDFKVRFNEANKSLTIENAPSNQVSLKNILSIKRAISRVTNFN
jgi:hypothetical protein